VFFVLIVAIPIAAIAVLVVDVTGDSAAGKADARLATGLETALSLYDDGVAGARREATALLQEPAVISALGSRDSAQIERVTGSLGRQRDITYLAITTPYAITDGDDLTPIESAIPIATATVNTTGDSGEFGLVASVTDSERYLEQLSGLTGLEAAVIGTDGEVAATNGATADDLPAAGSSSDVSLDGEDLRSASSGLPDSEDTRVTLFAPQEAGGFFDSSPRIALIVALFLAVALTGVFFMARTLQSQIAAMLDAARRIGSGDFSHRIPVHGRDEMAGLASEFNKMTDQLEGQIDQLRRQRRELDRSVQRLGEAFASGLDRDALLAIVAETALGACEAEYARVALENGTMIEVPAGAAGPARDAAVAAQKRSSREGSKVDARRDNGFALAAPLRSLGRDEPVGTLAIGRGGAVFGESEREVFLYLIGQASASIENISAHERVTEQAVTDELTGLPNNRAFRETIGREASRADRFGHELSLIILDVDNFKRVNDTHGHLQGDEVLRAIGQLLQSEPRAIDEPARYGGEEFVVALPETGTDGAVELAERIRERLAEHSIPLLDGSGALNVTASFGTATLPGAASTVRELFSVADEALYEAKRSGKNRVVTAPGAVRSRR